MVELNGKTLTCQGDDGWELKDDSHITVKGEACDKLKAGGAALMAKFPCNGVVVF
jgi:hypothetical protein